MALTPKERKQRQREWLAAGFVGEVRFQIHADGVDRLKQWKLLLEWDDGDLGAISEAVASLVNEGRGVRKVPPVVAPASASADAAAKSQRPAKPPRKVEPPLFTY